jgi:hypothetical protein
MFVAKTLGRPPFRGFLLTSPICRHSPELEDTLHCAGADPSVECNLMVLE